MFGVGIPEILTILVILLILLVPLLLLVYLLVRGGLRRARDAARRQSRESPHPD